MRKIYSLSSDHMKDFCPEKNGHKSDTENGSGQMYYHKIESCSCTK